MPRQARLDSPGTLHHVMILWGFEDIGEDFVQLVNSVPIPVLIPTDWIGSP